MNSILPILSVIVPTHNRQKYAEACVLTILKYCKNTEVILSDTSDSDELRLKLANEISDGRVKYVRPKQGIDVVQNFEIGFDNANGKYLAFIGDDDSIGPFIEEISNWADQNEVEAISTTRPADYYWPDFNSRFTGEKFSGVLTLHKFSGALNEIDGKKNIQKAIANLGEGVFEMPRAYMGLVSSALCKRIVNKYGTLFGGVSPDIYSAALISYESRRSVSIDYPFILPGSSGVSTAGQSAKGIHKGKLRDNPHIGAFKDLAWNSCIPEFYSVPTVWGFSIIEALSKINDKRFEPNYERLYANCLFWHFDYYSETLKSIKYHCVGKNKLLVYIKIFLQLVIVFFKLGYKFIEKFIYPLLNKKKKLIKAPSIDVAVEELMQKANVDVDNTPIYFKNKLT